MSFTGVQYDEGAYKKQIRESMGPGMYRVETPFPTRQPCAMETLTAHESDLLGLPRKMSDDPADLYQFGQNAAPGACALPNDGSRDSFERLQGEITRMSNPACNLRGTGVNRFAFLLENPQRHAISPVGSSQNDRRDAKDSHVPPAPVAYMTATAMPPPAPERVPAGPYEFPPVPMLPQVRRVAASAGGQPLQPYPQAQAQPYPQAQAPVPMPPA